MSVVVPQPQLHPMAEAALNEARSKGVEPTWADVAWLNGLAGRQASGRRRVIDYPVAVGGSELWPPTYGALDWYSTHGSRAGGGNLLAAFLLAHSRRPDVLLRLTEPRDIRKAVKAWADGLWCSKAELERAIDIVLDDDPSVELDSPYESKRARGRPSDWGDAVAALCRHYPGTPLSYWLWEASADQCRAMLDRADGPGGGEDEDERFRRFAEFRSALHEVIRRGLEANTANAAKVMT